MKNTRIGQVAAFGIALALSLGAGPATQPADTQKKRDLGRAEMSLRLKQQRAAEIARPGWNSPRRADPFIIPAPQAGALPRIAPPYLTPRSQWLERQTNGVTWYLIPCDALSAVAGAGGEIPVGRLALPATRPAPTAEEF